MINFSHIRVRVDIIGASCVRLSFAFLRWYTSARAPNENKCKRNQRGNQMWINPILISLDRETRKCIHQASVDKLSVYSGILKSMFAVIVPLTWARIWNPDTFFDYSGMSIINCISRFAFGCCWIADKLLAINNRWRFSSIIRYCKLFFSFHFCACIRHTRARAYDVHRAQRPRQLSHEGGKLHIFHAFQENDHFVSFVVFYVGFLGPN